MYLGLESLPDGDEGFAGDVFDLGSDEVIMIGKVVQDRKHECGEATPIKTPRTPRTFRLNPLAHLGQVNRLSRQTVVQLLSRDGECIANLDDLPEMDRGSAQSQHDFSVPRPESFFNESEESTTDVDELVDLGQPLPVGLREPAAQSHESSEPERTPSPSEREVCEALSLESQE